MAHTNNPVRGLWTAQGAKLVVSNQPLSLGVEGGVVYINGEPAQALLDCARAKGQAQEIMDDVFELKPLFCNSRGLPQPTRVIKGVVGQTPSVLLGAGDAELLAHPSGVLTMGALVLHPEPRLMSHGLGGVRIEPHPSALLAYPEDGRERLLFTEGAVAGAATVVVAGAAVAYALRALARVMAW